MKLKKLLSSVMALVMAISVASCGTPKDISYEDDESKEVALTYYFPGKVPGDNEKRVNEKISAYVKEKINATINFERLDWNAYQQKITTMISAGEPFDIVFTCSWCLPYVSNAERGAFLELSGLLDEYGKDIKNILDPDFLAASKVGGKQYTIPVNKERSHSVGFLFRKDLLEKYDIDASSIKNLDDLEKALAKAKEIDPDQYPLHVGKEGLTALLDFDNITGSTDTPGVLYSDGSSNEVVNQYATPEYMELAKITRRFYEKGYIRPDAATSATATGEVRFASVSVLKPGKDKESFDGEYEFVQAELTEPLMVTSDATGSMAAISATCENPARAMKFLNLLYTDPVLLDLLYYGEEGVDFEYDAEGRVVTKDEMYENSGWMFGNQKIAKLKTTEDTDKWEKMDEFDNSARVLDSLGFCFDPTNVSTEIATCANVVAEFGPIVGTGVQDPEETISKMLSKLEQAGAQRIIDEAQKQYDEFLASK